MSTTILDLPLPPAGERLSYGSGPLNFGDLRLPSGTGPHPLVIYVHGGFWRAQYDLGHGGHTCAALTAAGIATWNIEYRRLGNGGGWPATFDDVAAAADHVRVLTGTYNLDPARVISAGHSAGGHLALWLAARHRIPRGAPLHQQNPLALRAAVSLAGVVDLREAWKLRLGNGVVPDFMGGTPDEVPERYAVASPSELLPLGVPQLLVHGTLDDSVPYAMGEAYRRAAMTAGDAVSFMELPGADHFDPVDPRSTVWPAIVAAIEIVL